MRSCPADDPELLGGGGVLDLIVCEVCGEPLLGGFRKGPKQQGYPTDGAEILTADQPNLEDIPDRIGRTCSTRVTRSTGP